MKNVLILSTSPRKNSNSEALANAFAEGAAEDEDFVPQRAKSGLEGWVECFPKAKLAGMVFRGGVTETGEMAAHHTKLDEAYALGAQI